MRILRNAFCFLLLAWPMVSLAQTPPAEPALPTDPVAGLNTFGSQTNLGKQDLIKSVALIINIVLLLLGTIFTVLILLGGFKWMTSGGSSEKIGKAKEMISNAVIGLAIVMASYMIANFVVAKIYGATVKT